MLPMKCNQEQRHVLFQELREELKEIEESQDMSDSDDGVAGQSLSSGDMWRREDLDEAD